MRSTPWQELRDALGKPKDWQPEWATSFRAKKNGNVIIYEAAPELLETEALTELTEITGLGWNVEIDSTRLNRLRIQIWDHRIN